MKFEASNQTEAFTARMIFHTSYRYDKGKVD